VATSSGAAAALDGKEPDLEGNPYATLGQAEEQLLERESAVRMAMVFRVYAASGRFSDMSRRSLLRGTFCCGRCVANLFKMRSPHPVIRSYVNVEQMMCLEWRLLSQSAPALGYQRLDACTLTLSLVELAQAVADEFRTTWQGSGDLNPTSFSDRYVGDARRFEAMLRLHQVEDVPLRDHLRLTAQGLVGR
jgi:hypothetical protein